MLLALFLAFALVALFLQNRRIAALERSLARLTRGSDQGNLQDVLESHLDTVARVVGDVDELGDRSGPTRIRRPVARSSGSGSCATTRSTTRVATRALRWRCSTAVTTGS